MEFRVLSVISQPKFSTFLPSKRFSVIIIIIIIIIKNEKIKVTLGENAAGALYICNGPI